MNLPKTIAAITVVGALACIANIKPAYMYFSVTRPHQKLLELFRSSQEGTAYNNRLYEFCTSLQYNDYFNETPLMTYRMFRADVSSHTPFDEEINNEPVMEGPPGERTLRTASSSTLDPK
ncbi:MAG TPA: hypothetical protein VJJ82_02625 [Candidatus Nanoarchaeia archaeon]|nr:hypothetical protein [Candidatus Nanoarchaeia archaeon]